MDCPWGIHTERALNNFPLVGKSVNPRLLTACLQVKKACALTNRELGCLDDKADAMITACDDLLHSASRFPQLSSLQGGAGTSTNMMVNELIANKANAHPIEEVNLHQSTNDTYPTALKIAAINGVRELAESFAALQGVFQTLEKQNANIPGSKIRSNHVLRAPRRNGEASRRHGAPAIPGPATTGPSRTPDRSWRPRVPPAAAGRSRGRPRRQGARRAPARPHASPCRAISRHPGQ